MSAAAGTVAAQELTQVVTTWEDRLGARIGVVLRDTSTAREISHRSEERFPVSSTFKPLLCGAVLARVDAGSESLSNQVTYRSADLVTYSPVTEEHVDTGMNVADLCERRATCCWSVSGPQRASPSFCVESATPQPGSTVGKRR